MWLGWSPSIWLAYKHWLHNECQQQPLGFYSCWLHRMPHPIWQLSWTGTWKWTHQHHSMVGAVSYWHSIHSHQTSNSSPTRFLFMWDSGIWHTHTLLFAKPVSINECAASWWGEDESFSRDWKASSQTCKSSISFSYVKTHLLRPQSVHLSLSMTLVI